MKKFGLIGGIGPESTIEYYRLIIKRFQEKLATENYPEILISSVNMTELIGYAFNGRLTELLIFLEERIKTIEMAGVEFAALASNTPHLVFDQLSERVNIPLISIVEETCKIIAEKKLTRVGLLGTKSTMSSGFYNTVAAKLGIEIITPSQGEKNYVHKKYMSELIFNKIVPDTKIQLLNIVQKLKEEESIEGLILGGTELPLILTQSDFNDLVIFDTTAIHIESIVTKMIEN